MKRAGHLAIMGNEMCERRTRLSRKTEWEEARCTFVHYVASYFTKLKTFMYNPIVMVIIIITADENTIWQQNDMISIQKSASSDICWSPVTDKISWAILSNQHSHQQIICYERQQ
jgi:hypothetical protein